MDGTVTFKTRATSTRARLRAARRAQQLRTTGAARRTSCRTTFRSRLCHDLHPPSSSATSLGQPPTLAVAVTAAVAAVFAVAVAAVAAALAAFTAVAAVAAVSSAVAAALPKRRLCRLPALCLKSRGAAPSPQRMGRARRLFGRRAPARPARGAGSRAQAARCRCLPSGRCAQGWRSDQKPRIPQSR